MSVITRAMRNAQHRAHKVHHEIVDKMFSGVPLTATDRRRLAQARRTLDKIDRVVYKPAFRKMDREILAMQRIGNEIKELASRQGLST